eukprot:TRINITY_DN3004_c0_g1_i1.p1 TRINITY_DN3004_c0_g1~~TRINITY_DN3004_c0_g1_i1.p1  ORF type:complete len:669 (+),score=134.80 TRINITY_DN3004_c0_g1_i1:78-2084(+)
MESLRNLLKSRQDLQTLFPELPHDDALVEDYSCAIFKDILVHGRMYITKNHIAFKSNILGIKTSEIIPFVEVDLLVKTHFAYLFDNAIEITTVSGKKFTFASFAHRDQAFRTLESLWTTSKAISKLGLNPAGRSVRSKSPRLPFASSSAKTTNGDAESSPTDFTLSEEINETPPPEKQQKIEKNEKNTSKSDMNTSSEKVVMVFPCRIPSLPSVSNSLVFGDLQNSSSDMSEVSNQYHDSDSLDEVGVSRDSSTIAEDASQVAELSAEEHHTLPPPPPSSNDQQFTPRKTSSAEAQVETITITPSEGRSTHSPTKKANNLLETKAPDNAKVDKVLEKLGGKFGGEYYKMNTETISESRVECHHGSFDCHITFFWHTFWGPDSTFLQTLHKRRKDSELEIGRWKKKEAGVLERELRWVGPVSSPIGPKATKVTSQETCYILSESEFVVDTLTATHDVPYGDRFQVEVRYHIQSTVNGCDMKVYIKMIFHRNVWIRGVLENGAVKGTQEYCHVWEGLAQEFIRDKGSAAKSPRLVPAREGTMELTVKDKPIDKERKKTNERGEEKVKLKEKLQVKESETNVISETNTDETTTKRQTSQMKSKVEQKGLQSWVISLPFNVEVNWITLILILLIFLIFVFLLVSYFTFSSRLSYLEKEILLLKHGSQPFGYQ